MYDYVSGICTLAVAFLLLWQVVPWLYLNLLGPKLFGPKIRLKEMGQWALVTGATDGIGKAFVKALSKKGINLILVSRSLAKLKDVSKDIQNEFNVQTKIIAVDFTSGPEIYDAIEKQTADLEVGILVNNVGMSYANPEYFSALPDRLEFFDRMMACNVTSVLRMCGLFLPGMVKRRKGVVINVASIYVYLPGPLISVYAASKAFVAKFSDALATEYAGHGITVQSLEPGFVATKLSKFSRTNMVVCTPETYVTSALAMVGFARHSTGYFPHAVLLFCVNLLNFLSPSLCQFIFLKAAAAARQMQK
ncbi:very-long-chain 3-oxoacyl-CoA reductase [Culex quinquefasciatus]|uniref:very-long-chain 3-oxoacyl-CoA reductase n=1 Tax=Culex quinquefasciatus TaxID=7176 RepID=UPI0018E35474|nr:very-long-chain 3-oxoacyl-CoA reductase [Culex quinquefasciatus]